MNYYQNEKNYIIKFHKDLLPLQSISKEFDSSFYVLKGLLEFAFGYLDARILSSYESPRAKIPFPKWMLKLENEKFELWDIQTDHPTDAKLFKTSENKFKLFLKYCEVFQEVPGEISLALSISGCPLRCKGCHSTETYKTNFGTELTDTELDRLLEKHKHISCVLFYGGEWEISTLTKYLKTALG